MDNFLAKVQKEMIKLRKKNLNIVNEFKIEMYQTRKNIDRQLIEKQYGKINEQNKSTLTTAPNKKMSSFMKKDTQSIMFINHNNNKQSYDTSKRGSSYNYSTNHHSEAQNNFQSHFNNNQFQNTIYQNNKQNQDPNFRMKTDISVNQYESFGKENSKDDSKIKIKIDNEHFSITNQDGFDLNALKNDLSMEINTSDVKKKYMKFVSPSAGWTLSAASKKYKQQLKGINGQQHPLCSSFVHEPKYFDTQEDEIVEEDNQIHKDFDLFGFKGIDEGNFSRHNTIQELVEAEDFTQSINQ